MSCYHPLHVVSMGTKENGKKEIEFIKYLDEKICEIKKSRYRRINNTILTDKGPLEILEIPCGSCIGCRLSKASNTADQIMLEAKAFERNCVVHLTYNDKHLPKNKVIDTETGEVLETETLKPKDYQDFLKRLRIHYQRKYKNKKYKIRTSYCGEYGEQKGRPHAHMILFNFKPDDLEFWEKSKSGYNTYVSKEVSKIWGKGIVKVNDLSREMAEYIARYITKKWKGEDAKEKYQNNGKVPEFYHCSNRPGIGYSYYEKNKDTIYKTDEIFINSLKGTRSKKPPKYFDKLLEREDLTTLQEIKEKRKQNADQRMQTMLSITGWTKEEYLAMQEDARKEKVKALKRQKEAKQIIINEYGRRQYI